MPARALSERAKKQKSRLKYEERLQQAVAEYKAAQKTPNGFRKKGAVQFALKHGVKARTLLNHAKGQQTMAAFNKTKQVFSEAEENVLVDHLLCSAEMGFPLTHAHLVRTANHILATKGKKHVGESWADRFIIRHMDRLQTHWSKQLDMQRARGLNPTAVKEWFELVKTSIVDKDILPENIYAMDESGFPLGGGGKERVIGARGTKVQHKQCGGGKENVTVLVTICADGDSVAPSIIFKGEHFMKKWNDGNLVNASIAHSPNGWTDGGIALEWLQDHFDPLTQEKAKGAQRALILDGHSSHHNPDFLQYAINNKITILAYPSHCTHALQGLDVVFFARLKANWKEQVTKFEEEHHRPIKKDDFALVFSRAYLLSANTELVLSAFSKTGIYPYNPNAISPAQMKPSKSTSTKGSFPLTLQSPIRAVMAAFNATPSFSLGGLPRRCESAPSTPSRRRMPVGADPSMFTPSKRAWVMKENLLLTKSGSFLVLATEANYKNKPISPILEAIEPIDWSLLDDYEEPRSFAEAKKQNRELVSKLNESKEKIHTGKQIIESCQAQIVVQNIHLENMSQVLNEKGNSSTVDRTRVNHDGKGRLLTCTSFVQSLKDTAAQKEAEEEGKRLERQRKEERKKAQRALDQQWAAMKADYKLEVDRWKDVCIALLQQGTPKKGLPVRPSMPRKPALAPDNEFLEGSSGAGSPDVADGDGVCVDNEDNAINAINQPSCPDLEV